MSSTPVTPEDFTLATPIVVENKDLPRLPDSLDVTRRQRIAEAKVAAQSGDKFARTWLIDTARETGDQELIEFLRLTGLSAIESTIPQAPAVPSEYTFESVKALSLETFKRLMRDPVAKAKIEEAVAKGPTPVQTTDPTIIPDNTPAVDAAVEEARLKAEAEQKALEEETARKAAEAKAAEEKAAEEAKQQILKVQEEEARKKAEEEARPKQKIVREYQAKDENGNPIGKPTHIVADDWEDLANQLQKAHENAMRYAERLKTRKLTPPPPPEPEPLSEADLIQLQKDLETGTSAQKAEAIRKIAGDQIVKENRQLRDEVKQRRETEIGNRFVQLHKDDYNSCIANATILGNYLRENNLGFTLDNLEAAFDAVQDKLAPPTRQSREEVIPTPVPAPVVQQQAANPAPATPVNQPAAVVPQAQPIVAEPAPVVPAASVEPVPAPAPAANPVVTKAPTAGLQPGTMSGNRPETKAGPAKLTKQDVINMPREEYKRRMKNPDFKAYVNTLFATK